MNQISRMQNIQTTPEYIGYLILKQLNDKHKLSLIDCYWYIHNKIKWVSYKFITYSLIFLYATSTIDFDGVYFYKI